MAMKHLAVQADAASASAREIAEAYDIPIELMAKVLQRLVRRGLLASHQGTRGGYRLSRPTVDDLGRRHHPGDRRPADRDRLLDRRREVRPVRQVQHPRSAVADQGSHRRRAGDVLAAGDVGRRAARETVMPVSPLALTFSRTTRDRQARLSRLSRDDAGRSARARGDAARTSPRSSATPRAGSTPTAGRPSDAVDAARDQVAALIGASPARDSSSRAAPPNPTTSRSRGAPSASAIAAITSSPSRPSTSRCSTRASGWRRRAGG